MAKDIFKTDFCKITKFSCTCGRTYINTSNCKQCTCGNEKQTNADKIRAMSIKEMSTDLVNIFEELFEDGVPSPEWMEMWLQSEAE